MTPAWKQKITPDAVDMTAVLAAPRNSKAHNGRFCDLRYRVVDATAAREYCDA